MIQLGSKNPVKFTFSDELQETNVVLSPSDDSPTLCAKLQRVLELEGYAAAPRQAPVLTPEFTPADRAATEQRLAQAQPMGWAEDVDIDQLPEH